MPVPSLVDVRFRVRQLSCLQNDRTNERMTRERSHNLRLIDGCNINNNNNYYYNNNNNLYYNNNNLYYQ